MSGVVAPCMAASRISRAASTRPRKNCSRAAATACAGPDSPGVASPGTAGAAGCFAAGGCPAGGSAPLAGGAIGGSGADSTRGETPGGIGAAAGAGGVAGGVVVDRGRSGRNVSSWGAGCGAGRAALRPVELGARRLARPPRCVALDDGVRVTRGRRHGARITLPRADHGSRARARSPPQCRPAPTARCRAPIAAGVQMDMACMSPDPHVEMAGSRKLQFCDAGQAAAGMLSTDDLQPTPRPVTCLLPPGRSRRRRAAAFSAIWR